MNYAESVKFVKRAANKLKREVLRIPPFSIVYDTAYQAALGRHASELPWIRASDAEIVTALRERGARVVPIESLELPGTPAFLAAAAKLVEELKARPTNGGNAVRLPLERIIAHPEIYTWGLQDRLLDIVENYIGLPLMYHGADLRRELPDGRTTDVRQWHIDNEDKRMFKVICYINDVAADGGPFQYFDRQLTNQAAKALRYTYGFVSDERMNAVVPRADWVAATGPFGTAVIGDTCGIFHRATPPVGRDRFSVTFSFSSRRPVKIHDTVVFTQQQMQPILERLTDRQRATLPPKAYKA